MEPMNSGTASRFAHSDRARHGLSARTSAGTDSLFVPIALAIFAVAVFVRVFHLDYLSLWNDEIFSRYYYDLFGAKFLVTTGLTIEPTPPLYYFMLEPWMAAFGHSEVAMRSLSVVSSLIALPLVYAVARELSSRAIALTAAAVFAVSPMAVYFSQEARVYMFTVIPAALMLLGIARYLRQARNGDLAMYAFGAVIALYSHATFTFMVAACNAIVIAYLWFARIGAEEDAFAQSARFWFSRVGAIARWLVVNVIIAIAYLPLLVPMLSIGRHGTGLSWIPPLSFRDLLVAMSALVMGPITEMRFPGVELSGLMIAAVAGALMFAIMPRRALAVVVGIPVLFIALVTAASLKQPILIPRILCWVTLPLGVVIAYAIVVPSRLRVVARLTTLLAFGVGLYWQIALADGAKPPFREIFSQTRAELTHADDVVLAPYASAVLLKYYGPPIKHLVKWHDQAVTGIESNQMIEQFGIPLRSRQQVIDDIRSGKSVAMVVTSPDARFMPALMDNVPPPQRRVESTCNIVTRNGVQPPPCVAVYGWNMPSGAPLASQAPQ